MASVVNTSISIPVIYNFYLWYYLSFLRISQPMESWEISCHFEALSFGVLCFAVIRYLIPQVYSQLFLNGVTRFRYSVHLYLALNNLLISQILICSKRITAYCIKNFLENVPQAIRRSLKGASRWLWCWQHFCSVQWSRFMHPKVITLMLTKLEYSFLHLR